MFRNRAPGECDIGHMDQRGCMHVVKTAYSNNADWTVTIYVSRISVVALRNLLAIGTLLSTRSMVSLAGRLSCTVARHNRRQFMRVSDIFYFSRIRHNVWLWKSTAKIYQNILVWNGVQFKINTTTIIIMIIIMLIIVVDDFANPPPLLLLLIIILSPFSALSPIV